MGQNKANRELKRKRKKKLEKVKAERQAHKNGEWFAQRRSLLAEMRSEVLDKYGLSNELINIDNKSFKIPEQYKKEDDINTITTQHNIIGGSKEFVLACLEQILLELENDVISHSLILQNLIEIRQILNNPKHQCCEKVKEILLSASVDPVEIQEVLKKIKREKLYNTLNRCDKVFLHNIMNAIFGEYNEVSAIKKFDVGASKVTIDLCYRAIKQGLQDKKNIKDVSFYVDTGDVLVNFDIEYSEKFNNIPEEDEVFYPKWNSMDELDKNYSIFINKYPGITDDSARTLATAIAIEKEHISNLKSKKLVSFQGLSMNYFGVIEKEVTRLINLLENKKELKPLMWNKICTYFETNKIRYINVDNCLVDNIEWQITMRELHGTRNKAAHGEMIDYDEFEKVKSFALESQFLEMVSWLIIYIEKYGDIDSIPRNTPTPIKRISISTLNKAFDAI